jgi:hypothetical protein
VTSDALLPSRAGPVPDWLTIWPVDDGRYGLDATFHGASGYQRAQQHQSELELDGVPHTFRQDLDGSWTLRFGPLRAADIAQALSAFVYYSTTVEGEANLALCKLIAKRAGIAREGRARRCRLP